MTKGDLIAFLDADDLWVKENLRLNFDCHIVNEHDTDDLAHLDLYLMSICKHNIIANSPFSWWGAWLNCNNEKIVVSPKKWFVGEKNIKLSPNLRKLIKYIGVNTFYIYNNPFIFDKID